MTPENIKLAFQAISKCGPHSDVIAKQTTDYLNTNGLVIKTPYREGSTTYLENPWQNYIERIITHAALDFLRRDGKTEARKLRKQAAKLKAALGVMDSDHSTYGFRFCLTGAAAGQCTEVALEGIRETIRVYEETAAEYDRHEKHISFERCVRDRFREPPADRYTATVVRERCKSALPRPFPAVVRAVAVEIEAVLRPIDATTADKILMTVTREANEIRKLLA